MSDREDKKDVVRNRDNDRQNRMGKRFENDTNTNTTGSCKADTQKGTSCENDAQEGSEYCGKHAENEAGELTWDFERVQMHMTTEDKENVSRLQKQIELDERIDISKKEFEKTLIELATQNDDFQAELADTLVEKYDTDD